MVAAGPSSTQPSYEKANHICFDDLVVLNMPAVRKAVKWNSLFYGIEGQGWIVSFHVFTHYVKVTFFQGRSLRPVPPGGTAKDARWIDIHKADFDEALSPEDFERVLRVNTYAPLRLARVLLPNIAASEQKKIVSVSSGIGSLTRAPEFMQYAPAYYYAISKAGLNMEMRMLATELKPRGVLVGLVTPGMVDTAMQAHYRSASVAAGTPITAPMLTPARSARGVVDCIIGLNAEKSGRFFGNTGAELPW
jgi:NAD(P)-dependent dehydrogenase (short-subunit alcohol dehydrogenase family)